MEGDASAFNAAQLAVLADIAMGAPLPAALDAIVRLIERQAVGMVCSVLLLDDGRLRHGAAPHLPTDYVHAIDGSPIGPEAGSCGAAAARGERVVIEDIENHPYWKRYRHLALPHGLVACWSTPIFSPERRVLGTFAMYYRERRSPTPQELAWVATATHLASIAIVRTRAEGRVRKSEAHAHQLAQLHAVSSSVSEALVRIRDPQQLCDVACRIVVEMGLAVLAWIGVYHETEDRFEPLARFGDRHGYIDSIMPRIRDDKVNHGPGARAIRSGKVQIAHDIANDPDFPWTDLALRSGLRACAIFPLWLGKSRRAILVIYRAQPDAFADEINVFTTLTDNISFAFTSGETELERQRLLTRLHLLDDLGEAMRGASNLEQVLTVAATMLGRHLGVSRCGYAEIHDDGDHFTIAPGYSDGTPSIAGLYRMSDFGPRIAAAMRRGGAPLVVRDIDRELGPEDRRDRLDAAGVKAMINCTLLRSGVPRAMIAVHQLQPRNWTADDIRTVEEVGERCWSMIEQRAAEAKLRRNEEMLRLAGRAARLGAWSLELADLSLTWSDEVCAIHEVPAGTSPNLRDATAYYVPEHRDTILLAMASCARNGTPFDRELEITTATGRRIWVRAIGEAERNAAGAIERVHGAFQDISERRLLEDQLRQAQKMEAVGRLASGVAHDFNNVLSVILSYSSFLVDSLSPHDSVRADIEEIRKAGERAGQLTRQLLAFSRQQILRPRVIALNHIVAGLETMLRRMVGETIAVAFRPSAAIGNIIADPGQIDQVLMNLVVNARDAMPAGGSLIVETANVEIGASYVAGHPGVAPGPYVRLSVSDTGLGMDAATRLRIFEPFFTTKEKGKGTGLGLATVYGIVQQSGGHIEVDSAPSKGTAFRVYFPRVEAPIEAADPDERPIALRGAETVLLVEDDGQVRKTVGSILRRAGYFVLEAQSATEALVVAERYRERIHVLVTDVVMPQIGGRRLAECLAPLRPDLQVLYMSGYTYESIVHDEALAADAAFLAKPITPDVLLRKLRDVLADPPIADAPLDKPRRATRRSVSPPQGEGRHILHLDDEDSLVHLMARILKRLGYRVSSFTDPAEALHTFQHEPASFDAIVTDVTMRGMTGFELVREVRQVRPDIPVVLTSGDFRPEDIRTAEAMRIRDLVVKPDTVEELGRVLHELFTQQTS